MTRQPTAWFSRNYFYKCAKSDSNCGRILKFAKLEDKRYMTNVIFKIVNRHISVKHHQFLMQIFKSKTVRTMPSKDWRNSDQVVTNSNTSSLIGPHCWYLCMLSSFSEVVVKLYTLRFVLFFAYHSWWIKDVQFIMRLTPRGRNKCCTQSVRPSVRPSDLCLRLYRNRKDVETSYLVEALVLHRDKKIN